MNTRELQFAISPWHKGMDIYRKVDFDWVFEPRSLNLDLIALATLDDYHQELNKFLKNIPQDVLSFVGQFRGCQFSLLKGLITSEIARELTTKSPALLWKLVDYMRRYSIPIEEIIKFDGLKRLDIIRIIYGDFPKTTLISMDRFLKKIVFTQNNYIDSINMICVDVAVKSSKHRLALSSMGEIPMILLDLLLSQPEYLSYPLIFRLPVTDYWEEEAVESIKYQLGRNYEYCRDALATARLLKVTNARKILNQCKNANELYALHDEWVSRMNSSEYFQLSNEPFPAPPIPGTPGIEPIKNGIELSTEGKQMKHCVSNYCASIYAGDKYVYRVLKPERGTLMLQKKADCWDIEEFKLTQNQTPSKMSWDCIQGWYNKYS